MKISWAVCTHYFVVYARVRTLNCTSFTFSVTHLHANCFAAKSSANDVHKSCNRRTKRAGSDSLPNVRSTLTDLRLESSSSLSPPPTCVEPNPMADRTKNSYVAV